MGIVTLALFQLVFKLFLGLFAVCILGWDILLLFFAEIGRRDDLRRATSKTPPPFRFAIIIPLLNELDKPALSQLIDALLHQTPSQTKQPDIYVVSPEAVHTGMLSVSHAFPETVHFLPYPDQIATCAVKKIHTKETIGEMHAWAVERLLALGGNTRLFVFLEATDIVRSDYLQQIAMKAAYYPVLQGYLAMKKLDEDMTSRNIGLKQRLLNRIEQAGRFHLGLSASLQPTGWCAHQDVLEKVPLDRFLIDYPKAYGLILNRVGYRINWAPSVVTYKDETLNFWQYMESQCFSVVSQVKLFINQLPQSLKFITARKQPLTAISQLWDILPIPHAYMGILLLVIWGTISNSPYAGFMGAMFFAYTILQVAKLFVARIRFQDALFSSGLVVWYRFASLAALPFVAIKLLINNFILPNSAVSLQRKNGLYNLSETTRKLQLPNISLADESWKEENTKPIDNNNYQPVRESDIGLKSVSPVLQDTIKPAITAQLTNGDKVLDCLIVVNQLDQGVPGYPDTQYQLQLSYRGNTFSTSFYHDKDEAFASLQEKLSQKGFSILLDSPQLSSK